jgi:hypothetical protein
MNISLKSLISEKFVKASNIFRRSGDSLSDKSLVERHALSDGTTLSIHVSLQFRPKYPDRKNPQIKKVWWLWLFTSDKTGKNSDYSLELYDKNQIKNIINIARAQKGLLSSIPSKQREKIIKGWFKKYVPEFKDYKI